MAFEQAYYTSCTVGLRGSDGLQVNAASAGVDAAALAHVERLAVYLAPGSTPSRPGREEIERLPVSLQYQPLGDGRALVGQARYVGADYSGRFGNFFTHFLLGARPAEDFRDFLPIELWRSPSWNTVESGSTSLPPLDAPAAGTSMDVLRVQAFLAEESRLEQVPAFLTAVQRALETRRRIILVDGDDAVACWIAVASYALPRHHALQLSFNTYTKNPYRAEALVVGTTPDSDFRFAPHEIDHQYFVFDFVGRRFTRVPTPTRFALGAAAAFAAGRAEHVAALGRFVERVAPALPLAELDVAAACHALATGLEATGVSAEEALGWCAPRASALDLATLEPLVSALLRAGPCTPALLAAGAAFHRDAVRCGASADRRAAIECALVEWLVTAAAPALPPDLLLRAIRDLALAPELEPPPAVAQAWSDAVRRALDDGPRAAMLAVLADRAHLLRTGGTTARWLGEAALGPALGDATVQAATLALAATPAGGDLLRGIAAYLATRVAETVRFTAMRPVLRQEAVAGPLREFARETRNVSLAIRLAAGAAAEGRDARVNAWRAAIAAIAGTGVALSPEHVALAFATAWEDREPTLDEALQVLDGAPPELLAQTAVPAALARALGGTGDLGSSAAHQLAARLRTKPLAAALEDVAVPDAFACAARLQRREGDPAREIEDAARRAGGLPPALAEALLAVAADALLHVADVPRHLDVLAAGDAASARRLLPAYGRAVDRTLERTPGPEVVAWLWRVAHAARARRAEDTERLLAGSVRRVVARWSGRERAAVSERLVLDPGARGSWDALASTLGGGLASRLASWLSGGRAS